jgi:hypothetical protein
VSIKTDDIPSGNILAEIILTTTNNNRLIMLKRGSSFSKSFPARADYTYVLDISGAYSTSTRRTTYTINFLCHQDVSASSSTATQNVLSPIKLSAVLAGPKFPVCVELPDANFWGEPRLMLEQPYHRSIQLIN